MSTLKSENFNLKNLKDYIRFNIATANKSKVHAAFESSLLVNMANSDSTLSEDLSL